MTETTIDTTDQEFREIVLGLIAEQAAAEVTADSKLSELDLDSLDVVELVHTVKFKFDIALTAFDVIHAGTAGEVADIVVDKRG
ncbi:acyl carrier protein [Williamsia sterculiae]|uniref:Acyl carrier protein n=1 Tax=Williamsia sterculiae TaxID=1344003 RepID=A0A1N7DP70_9NOCA|nr:acyl carrier protein [Williamsia sterculiae]SIR77672.1 acyl carrier protein [Williamsia sterculiae]